MPRARPEATRAFYAATGQRVREARLNRGLTQDALASQVSLTRTSIVNIEKGKQQILLHTIVDIARALGAEPAELLPNIAPSLNQDLNTLLRAHPHKTRMWIKSGVGSFRKGS